MPTDTELLDAWQAGDRRAGEALVGRHFQAVARFFRNKVSRGADDLVQRTFLGCVEGRARFRRESSFRTFLFSVARYVLFEHLRAQRRASSREVELGESSVFDIDPTPSQEVAREEEKQLVLEALRRLPVDLQVALELYYWEDLSLAELAGILEIPAGTVKSKLFRARQQLKAQIERLAANPTLRRRSIESIDDLQRKAERRTGDSLDG